MKQSSPIKILIIDDFVLDIHFITRQLMCDEVHELNKVNYDIQSATTGGEGLVLAKDFQPSCILLDYGLPDMNGLEFIDSLVELRGKLDVPIVMLTGQGDERVAVQAMKRGVHDYLIKGSFNASQLTWTISSALEKAKLQRQILSKHEELEMCATRMAHDILSPLSNLSLYLEFLEPYVSHIDFSKPPTENNNSASTSDTDTFNMISASVEHVISMVKAFRTYAKVGRTDLTFAEVNLNSVVKHILLVLDAQIAEAGAEIIVNPLPVVIGDSSGLGQLLQNLISNAIKYCDEKPRIEISASHQESKWEIKIRDNGIGIGQGGMDEMQQMIFEPFTRMHSYTDYPGSGIGLATCQKIVKQHGGEIWYESNPDKGTTFYFTMERNHEIVTSAISDRLIENLAQFEEQTMLDEGDRVYHRYMDLSTLSPNVGKFQAASVYQGAEHHSPNGYLTA